MRLVPAEFQVRWERISLSGTPDGAESQQNAKVETAGDKLCSYVPLVSGRRKEARSNVLEHVLVCTWNYLWVQQPWCVCWDPPPPRPGGCCTTFSGCARGCWALGRSSSRASNSHWPSPSPDGAGPRCWPHIVWGQFCPQGRLWQALPPAEACTPCSVIVGLFGCPAGRWPFPAPM